MFPALTASRRPSLTVPVLFTATTCLSASLLFFVQPLFARMVLPNVGGAPAVWTTAMLFFQTVLIAGYLYAHLSSRFLGLRTQVVLHLLLWAMALFFLPLSISEGWRYDADGSAFVQTLALFAAGVGLPFAVLSATTPLIQSWYAKSDGPSAGDPYFLYGAANLGALIALLAFPLVAEPLFGVSGMGHGWTVGFVLLGAFLALSGVAAGALHPRAGQPARMASRVASTAAPEWRQIAGWALLAFVPSSLMLAMTSWVSIDLGAMPLIWVVPLALYLLSFVLTFTNRPALPPLLLRAGFILAILALSLGFSGLLDLRLSLGAAATMGVAFFLAALFTHRKLYDSRPDRTHLTIFYLTMAVGAALGGLFNAILAPAFFSGMLEGPVTVAIAALLLIRSEPAAGSDRALPARALTVASLAGLVAVAGVLAFAGLRSSDSTLFRDRSFFGPHDVRDEAGLRVYRNGTTIHGGERLADFGRGRPEPLFYYHRNGPMAQVLTSEIGLRARRVGVVGLGIGALACYRWPGQEWHFYEVDATVDRIARDPAFFTFVSECAPGAPTHMGDGRVVLTGQPDMKFDLLVIDAYSSDSVPLHLTTTEAMALYRERLAPGGVLVYHTSSRHFAIHRPLGRSAEALGMEARVQFYGGHAEQDPADVASRAVIVARGADDFGSLAADPRWQVLWNDGDRLWTDDYANALSILH